MRSSSSGAPCAFPKGLKMGPFRKYMYDESTRVGQSRAVYVTAQTLRRGSDQG